MALIQAKNNKEGEVFMRWLHSRLIVHNKNVLGANLGPTGSGKSYRDLRMFELWYERQFKEKAPVENICFGVASVMNLISSGKLRRGEIIVFEEAGVNLGSRDFQNKISKMMNYVLQSFRSMNVGIFFNLPYLSMLDSQARHLLHYSFESVGIDYEKGLNYCKPFFHQVNQGTGKIYKKYLRLNAVGGYTKMKKLAFARPSQYLVDAYEAKKQKYLMELTAGFAKTLNIGVDKPKSNYPTEDKWEAYHLYHKMGSTQEAIGKHQGKGQKTVGNHIKEVEKYLELTKMHEKSVAVVLLERKRLPIPATTQLGSEES